MGMHERTSGEADGRPLGVGGAETLELAEFASALGMATWLMTMSPKHKGLPIEAIDRRVLPAIVLKQFKIVRKGNTPVAFLAWATVSEEARARLEAGTPLELGEWRSGPHLVVVECVSPFAPAAEVEARFLQTVSESAS